jgi:ParB family transcriptional regulator, chromosome partitioning protein
VPIEAIQYLSVADIQLAPQIRQADDESIHNLAAACREVGQLQAIRIRRDGDKLIVVDGERRLRAAHLLGWEKIAAIVEERELSASDIIQRQLIANIQRKNLSGLEAAHAIEKLVQHTGSAKQVAAMLGVSGGTVSKLRALLKFPASMQEQVQNGSLPASTAYALKKAKDPARQAELANEAANGRLTRDSATKKAKYKGERKPKTKRAPKPRATMSLGSGRSMTVTGEGLSLETMIAWLDAFLGKARLAQSQGVDLTAFFKALKDQARA